MESQGVFSRFSVVQTSSPLIIGYAFSFLKLVAWHLLVLFSVFRLPRHKVFQFHQAHNVPMADHSFRLRQTFAGHGPSSTDASSLPACRKHHRLHNHHFVQSRFFRLRVYLTLKSYGRVVFNIWTFAMGQIKTHIYPDAMIRVSLIPTPYEEFRQPARNDSLSASHAVHYI